MELSLLKENNAAFTVTSYSMQIKTWLSYLVYIYKLYIFYIVLNKIINIIITSTVIIIITIINLNIYMTI